ncbi:zinc cluster transcription factor [Salix suchowensis]|nr:zinc cluster transcription factor [Salix suchowensis]
MRRRVALQQLVGNSLATAPGGALTTQRPQLLRLKDLLLHRCLWPPSARSQAVSAARQGRLQCPGHQQNTAKCTANTAHVSSRDPVSYLSPHPQPHPQQNRNQANGYPPNVSLSPTTPSSATAATPAAAQGDHIEPPEDEGLALRKRPRPDRDGMPIDPPNATPGIIERPVQVTLDHGLTRELTNPLQLNRVPIYLLHAVCALAAPLSKQLRLRTNPMRNAGRPFAQEAMSLMFDGAGRLKADPNLATAQALCLLQLHEMSVFDTSAGLTIWGTRYHEAWGRLGAGDSWRWHAWIGSTSHLAGGGGPRNWSIHQTELKLRLPVDETSFELSVHSTLPGKEPGLYKPRLFYLTPLPEYLFLPGIRTQYASELGHLIRVLTIYAKIEHALDLLNGWRSSKEPYSNLLTKYCTICRPRRTRRPACSAPRGRDSS